MGSVDIMAQNRFARANQNAKRLHGAPNPQIGSPLMYSPARCAVSHTTMTNRRNNNNNNKQVVLSRNRPNSIVQSKKQTSAYSSVRQSSLFNSSPSRPRLPQYITCLLDPFNQDCNGTKVPDINQLPSTTAVMHDRKSGSTNAAGLVVAMYTADPGNILYSPATYATASSWNWPITWDLFATSETAAYGNYKVNCATSRTVSFGVKLSCPASITVASGLVHVCMVPSNYAEGPQSTFPSSFGAMRVMPGYMTVPLANLIQDSVIIPGRLADEGAHRYRATGRPWFMNTDNVVTGIESSTGWSHILVAIEGGPPDAAAVLSFDLVYHAEGVARPGTAVMTANETPAPYLPQLISAAMNVMRHIPFARILDGSSQTQEPAFWKTVENAVASVSRIAAMPAARLLLTL